MKNLDVKRRNAWGIAAVGIAVAALLVMARVPAGAQTTSNTMTAQQAIHDLKANYGIMIIPRDGVDLNTIVNSSVAENPYGGPSMAIQRLARAMDARSRMVFIVVPATADRPVTTLADARSFDDSGGTITLHLSGMPAQDAIQTVAASDNAAVDLRSDVGDRTVNLDGTDMSVAQAVAQIAAQTDTHWIQAYELTPPQATLAKAPQYHRNQPYMTITDNEGPTGPVYFHPTPPPAPPAPAANDKDKNDQTADNTAANQPAQALVPVVPANTLPPYFVMQNGYGYDPFGNPYPTTTTGFSYGGGYVPGSGLYLTPGFGYGGWGSPGVFGGSTTTTF